MNDGVRVTHTLEDFFALQARNLPAYGQYRYPENVYCLLPAESDLAAVQAWLHERAKSRHTNFSYYKEVARLYLWASAVRKVPLSGMTREDIHAFLDFVKDVPVTWQGPPVARRKRDGSSNPDWKPFAGPLSESSIAQMLRVISAMYRHWYECRYMVINPLQNPIEDAPKSHPKTSTLRYLEPAAWSYLRCYLYELPRNTWQEIRYSERARWIFHFAYFSGARLSEMAGAKMSDFRQEQNAWWLHLNNGDNERRVLVSDEFMMALRRYRCHLAMPALPAPNEIGHSICRLSGNKGLTRKSIYLVVKEIFKKASEALERENPTIASPLSQASTHWLRYTCHALPQR